MIKIGQIFKPYSAKIVKGGKYTAFSLPQYHRKADGGGTVNDGFINLLTPGEYNFQKGDRIKVLKINGSELRNWNGRQYFSLYGDIEFIPASVVLAEPNAEILDGDIPDDML